MELKELIKDDEAVSPVIGVILMVAITVILAAVIGAFVLGIGGSQEQVPQASWEWTQDGSSSISADEQCGDLGNGGGIEVAVSHQGGDEISSDNLELGGQSCSGTTVNAGTTLKVIDASSGNSINLVWVSPSSDDTNILSDYDVS